jgi:hypothetical protein
VDGWPPVELAWFVLELDWLPVELGWPLAVFGWLSDWVCGPLAFAAVCCVPLLSLLLLSDVAADDVGALNFALWESLLLLLVLPANCC